MMSRSKRIFVGITIMFGVTFMAACSGTKPASNVHQYIDTETGITLTGLQEPAIFYHASPRLAANVRDYLYVGPVEMNRMGKLANYLWIAEWSTIDRRPGESSVTPVASPFAEVVLFLDGLPMLLQDQHDKNDRKGVPLKPYSLPVDTINSVYMRVSRDQLRRIAAAKTMTISVSGIDRRRTYKLWSGNPRLFESIIQDPAMQKDRRLVKTSD
jgi:hypothetical protein